MRARIRCSRDTSARMGNIRQRGTEPELAVRAMLTALGVRYRTGNRDLPGSPDLANRGRHWAIFVHGCFWHAHPGCVKATMPNGESVALLRPRSAMVAHS